MPEIVAPTTRTPAQIHDLRHAFVKGYMKAMFPGGSEHSAKYATAQAVARSLAAAMIPFNSPLTDPPMQEAPPIVGVNTAMTEAPR